MHFYKRDIISSMENENLVEPTKSPHSLVVLVITILLILGAGYFLYVKNSTKDEDAPTLEVAKYFLLKDSTFSYNLDTKPVEIKLIDLPESLKFILPTEETSSNTLIKKSTVEGKNIYVITFIQRSALPTTHRDLNVLLGKANEWKVTKSSRTKSFAVIEAESDKYKLQVRETFIDESYTDVVVDIVQK